MTYMPRINRRAFMIGTAAAGGGLAVGFELPFGPKLVRAADGTPEVNAWVVIRPDDTVVIRVARSEMGQGTLTGLAQLVAEELECDWSKVTTEFVTPGENVAKKRLWGQMQSTGSQGIRQSNEYVRQGGAAAREMLIQAAANEWKVPAAECSAANSVITHKASGRTTTYGKVADAAAKLTAPKDVKLKEVKDWKIAGKGVKRLDTYNKLIGKQEYGIDIKLPGMLIANINACPVNGGKLKSFDPTKVAGMPGVKKVVSVDDNAVAVIADTFWHAKTAVDALPHEVGAPASAEAAAGVLGLVELALLGRQAGGFDDGRECGLGILGRTEAFAAVGRPVYRHVHRLHRGVVLERIVVDRIDLLGGARDGGGGIAGLVADIGLVGAESGLDELGDGGA